MIRCDNCGNEFEGTEQHMDSLREVLCADCIESRKLVEEDDDE